MEITGGRGWWGCKIDYDLGIYSEYDEDTTNNIGDKVMRLKLPDGWSFGGTDGYSTDYLYFNVDRMPPQPELDEVERLILKIISEETKL